MKTCTKCGETKELGEFTHTKQRGKPYIMPRCKQCEKELFRKRYAANPEKSRGRLRDYYAANGEKVRGKQRNYYVANKEKARTAVHKWNKSNPEKVRANCRKQYLTAIAKYGAENLGAAASARRYEKLYGEIDPGFTNWTYEPRKRAPK